MTQTAEILTHLVDVFDLECCLDVVDTAVQVWVRISIDFGHDLPRKRVEICLRICRNFCQKKLSHVVVDGDVEQVVDVDHVVDVVEGQ